MLPVNEYPQFESRASARWAKPGGPFDPHTGSRYVYSQIADVSYKRLTREIAVPAGGGDLTFWTSYDTEAGVGLPRGRSEDGGRQRLDDAAGRQPRAQPGHG